MSVESPITREHGWHRFETKNLRFTITDSAGDPVNLNGVVLQWLLLRQQGDAESTAYLNKTTSSGITVDGDDDDIAVVAIDDSEYDSLNAGTYHHELWDRDNDVLLAFGDAVLMGGTKDAA